MDETVDRSAPSICAGKREERQETRRRLIYLCSLRYNHPTRKDGDRRRRLVGFYERSECYSVQFLPEYRRPLCRRKGSESVVWQERDQRDHTRSSFVLNFNQSSAFSALGSPDRGLLRSISSVSSRWTRRSPWSSELAQSGYLDLFQKKNGLWSGQIPKDLASPSEFHWQHQFSPGLKSFINALRTAHLPSFFEEVN
jgi:hypothetical protein